MSDFDLTHFLKTLPERPGVYQMFNAQDEVIYVGKARNLRRRVRSYFQKHHDNPKTRRLVEQIARIEVTLTETEAEALLLESTLIKRLHPRYNVIFRDDKSYPYIFVSTEQPFPGLYFHRGARKRKGRYFGPFPDAGAVYETLHTLQKIFPVRQCSDSVFRNRSRPCLQYQIGRCTAPCVGLISEAEYAEDVAHTLMFLEGRSHEVIEALGEAMQQAAEALEFEKAARLRDRIAALRAVQNQLLINQQEAVDVIGVAESGGRIALTLMRYQGGTLWGTRHYFPKGELLSPAAVVEQFIVQHYGEDRFPGRILIPKDAADALEWLQAWGAPVRCPRTRTEKALAQLAEENALTALRQRMAEAVSMTARLERLQHLLGLQTRPDVMECFDISHFQGSETVASCVCFVEGVPEKRRYRRFNIREAAAGDDYAALHEALTRHYTRLSTRPDSLPDLVVIDGGRGQLNRAREALDALGLQRLPVISVTKGEGRKAGLEIIHTLDRPEGIDLPSDDPVLHLINFLRDEAHRFAITGQRRRQRKRQLQTTLEAIPGVGPKIRRRLLTHFGGLRAVQDAPVSELEKVPGVSRTLAQRIYDYFHESL